MRVERAVLVVGEEVEEEGRWFVGMVVAEVEAEGWKAEEVAVD